MLYEESPPNKEKAPLCAGQSRLMLLNPAGVQGFEPQLADPESAVLPLNDTPISLV